MKKKCSKSSKKVNTKPSAGAEQSCTKRVENNVLPHSESCPVKPHAIRNAIVKTPVVLAEEKVTICVDSKIKFPEPVLEIKAIKKNLKIVQCRLLAPTNKLFLRGFIRKNIQYATPIKVKHGAVQSEIHSLTVDIPFDTCVDITFLTEAQFHKNPENKQFTFLSETELPFGFSQKEKLMSADFSQFDQVSSEFFNELPFCELISSSIVEYDEFLDRKMGKVCNRYGERLDAPFEEGTFTCVEEKMLVTIVFKVLQKQQVKISSYDPYCDKYDERS